MIRKQIYLFLITLCITGIINGQEENDHFNMVVFVADDLGRNDIGPYGNRVVKTPNLDELGQKALVFNQAFATSPTCAPSRASIHTGLMPFRNGAHANHTGIKKGVKTLPTYLKEEGYVVGLAGKLHIGPLEYYPFDLIDGTNVPEPGHENDGVLWTNLNLDPVDKWLDSAAKDTDRPFVLFVNDHSPHVIWPDQPQYDKSEVDIPPMHIDTDDTRKSRARYYTDITKMDTNVGKLRSLIRKHGLDKNTIFIFTADQGPQWAFGKWNLYDYGIQVPLMVHWPGKTFNTDHTEKLVSLTDLLPTMIEIAGGISPTDIDGTSFLGVINGNSSENRNRVYGSHTGDRSMNRTPMRMIRTNRYKYIYNLAPQEEYHTHIDKAKDHDGGREYWDSWRSKSFSGNNHASSLMWRYHNRPEEELYDIQNDPQEKNNLAENYHYQKILKDFRKEMEKWRRTQNDNEVGPFQPEHNSKENVTPYVFGMDR